jgi:hypothetical protein
MIAELDDTYLQVGISIIENRHRWRLYPEQDTHIFAR